MIRAFIMAAQQMSDPRARRVIWFAIAAAAGAFILLWVTIGFLITNTALFSIRWLETGVDWLGGLATGILSWLLFPTAIIAVIGLFLEEIASAVEARHYPDLGIAHGQNISDTVLTTLRFLSIMLVLNILMLPLLLTGPLFPFVFFSVNGYILGREYFELVALRRIGASEATTLRKKNSLKLFTTGALIAFLLTVPVINLLVPIIATAMMVHLFEDFRNHA